MNDVASLGGTITTRGHCHRQVCSIIMHVINSRVVLEQSEPFQKERKMQFVSIIRPLSVSHRQFHCLTLG